MTRTYRQIVADHRRHYPHQVKLANAGDWRDRHCSHKAREIMPGPLAQWFEGHGDRLWVYGFETVEQATSFKAWSETCGIDWSVPPAEQPIDSRPAAPQTGPDGYPLTGATWRRIWTTTKSSALTAPFANA